MEPIVPVDLLIRYALGLALFAAIVLVAYGIMRREPPGARNWNGPAERNPRHGL